MREIFRGYIVVACPTETNRDNIYHPTCANAGNINSNMNHQSVNLLLLLLLLKGIQLLFKTDLTEVSSCGLGRRPDSRTTISNDNDKKGSYNSYDNKWFTNMLYLTVLAYFSKA